MIEELLSPANFELSLHAVQSSFAAIFLLIFSAYLLFQNKKSLTNITFSTVSVAAAIWLSGTSFASIIIDQSLAFSVYKYYTFLGIALIAPGIYFLTVNTLKLDGKKNVVIAYYLIALVFYVVNLSGDWFAIGMEEKAWGNYVQYGPYSLTFLAFFFLLMLQSFFYYYSYLKKDLPSSERDRVKLHFISLLIAYIGAVDFLPTFGIDIYPIGFAPVFIFIFIQFYAILKYKLIITVNETFDNLKDGIITVDKNGKIKDINQSAKMMFETESTHAKSIDEVFPNLSGYLERLKDPSCDIIDEEIPFDLMNPNVGDRTLHLTISQIRNDFSGNMGMVIVLSDITERKLSDLAIRESEEKYRNLIERANEGVIIIQDNVIKFANEKTTDISGFKKDELIGKNFLKILPSASKQDLVKRYLDRLAGKDVQKQYEIDFLKRDGNTIVIEVNAGIIEYEGRPADFVYLNDITERKRVEEKIRRSEETNRLLFENAVDPMLVIDEKAILIRVNKKIEEILGYEREDFIGKNIFSIGLIEKSSLKVIMKNLQRRVKGVDVPLYDVKLISSDGNVKTFELNASRLEEGNKRANIMVILRDKTERNKIQSELRESEARYRNVLENMDYGYYEVDTKGDLTFFNNSLCKILGYTRAELVGMNNREYMEPDVARSVFNKFNQIYNTGKTVKSFSYEVIRKDGKIRSIEASISCMEDVTGNKVGFRGIVRDITEKIRFEEEFAEFSRINNLIFENAVDPMIVIDRKGKIIRMNRKIETDLGYTKDEYLGKNLFKIGLIAQDSIITAIAQLQRRLRGEESKPYEINLVHREGRVIPYELNASWFEEDGKLIGDIIIMRDISERKEAEEALKIEQMKYKNVVDNIGEGIIVTNDRGFITFTNSETEKILRYERDGLIGKHINEVSSDSTKKMILPLMNNVLKGNNIHDFEMELLRKDGLPLIVELTISPRLEDGKITEMMGIIRDITEKKHAEEMIDLERMKYKNVVENIGDGLFVSDENGSVTYANPAAEKITGYLDGCLVNKNIFDLVQKRNHSVLLLGMKALSQGESFRNVEIEFIRRDGEIRIIGLTITPRIKDGELTRVMGVIRDITEEKRSKETIAIERERYKEIVENIEEGLFKIDMKGRVNFINPKVAERLTGFDIGEIEGKLLTTLAPKQEIVKLGPGLQRLVRGETIRNLDTNILKKDGSTLPSFMSLTPIVRNGKVREIFGVLNDISDVKNAEEALKAEQEKYKTVVENIGEGLFITGTDGKILYVNPEAERISGYPAEDIVGRPFTNILTRDVQRTVLPGISKILKGESIRNMESRFIRKDGTPIMISLTISPNMKDGKITEIMGVMRDITEQKKADDQLLTHRARLQERTSQLEMANQMLSQSEDRYKMLIENANDCIFHLDKSLRIVDINKRAIEMYGAKKEDIIGKNALALGLMPKKGDFKEYITILRDIMNGRLDNVSDIEATIKNKRGETVFLEANNSIARVKGEVTGMLVIARDVTDRKLMEEELKAKYDELIKREEELQALNEEMEAQNEELGGNYQKLLNLSEQLKMQQDIQKAFTGVISILNSTINLESLLNRSLDSIAEFLSCQVGAIYLYDKKRDVLTPYATHGICDELKDNEYKLGEGTVGQTAVLKRAQYIEEIPDDTNLVIRTIIGDIIPRTIMTYPIIYQDELVGVIELGSASYTLGEEMVTYIDGIISQMGIAIKNSMAYENIQNLADELDLKNKEIQEANRLKSEFLANMSHELRTPMNSIIGFSNRVLKKSSHLLPERQFKNLEAVNRNAHNLLALINDILDLSKIEAGKMDVYYETFDIREIISEVADAIAPLANDKGLELDKTIENATVRSDKNKIKQILINLLGNAIKFTNKGNIEVISKVLRDGNIQMVIKDTGVGIKKEDLGIIFDEFRQVDGSSTRKEGGTGLGLSITKKFVEILGGSIKAESEYGVGSSFIVTIPTNIEVQTKAEEVIDTKGEIEELETDAYSSEKHNLMVLCIDDEKDVSELLNQYLSDEGYRVILANNGTEGVKKAKELQPDVITLDIMMPNVNGWEVISKLKQDPETADIPVIVISIMDDKNRAYRLGAKDYLLKPIEQDALINSINKLYIEEIKDILLIEDDVDSVNLVTELLKDRNINIRVANNGFDGIKLLREFKPQLILLDLMMPGMDGFEFIEVIKKVKESAEIPIIVLTAKKLNKDDREYLDRHVSSVLEKNGSEMHEILDEISRTIRQEKEAHKKDIGKEMEVLL